MLLYLTVLLTALLFNASVCSAQDKIKLADVVKIELIVKEGGFFTEHYRKIALAKEDNVWKAYQLELFDDYDLKTRTQINDSTKTFVKVMPEDTLSFLVDAVSGRDTAIHLERFNIDKMELVKNIDSLNFHIGVNADVDEYPLTYESHFVFIKLLQTDSVVNKAAIHLLHHRKWDDESVYIVNITTKNKTVYTAHAFNFAYPYFLPWHTADGGISYNPNITMVFEILMNNV